MPISPARARIRVAHVSQCLDMGGQEKLLVEFARHADRRRFDLHFVSLGTRGLLARELEDCGWRVSHLNLSCGLAPRLIWRLAQFFRRHKITAVHTHNLRPMVYAAPAARLAGVRRVIHTRHGRRLHTSRRQLFLAQCTARLVDPFVCVSEDCRRLSLAEGVAGQRLHTIRNGIDIRRFTYTGPQAQGPALIVARLSPEKDIATLLHALAMVCQEDPAFRLIIAGDGPCRMDLQQLAAELGLRKAVTFLGMRHDVPQLMARAGLYVLSSISEGISLTLLEAMARGLPVVATQVGGTAEVVDDGATGVLVPASDPKALAQALLMVQRQPDWARQLGSAGRQRVEVHFDIRQMVARYEELYES